MSLGHRAGPVSQTFCGADRHHASDVRRRYMIWQGRRLRWSSAGLTSSRTGRSRIHKAETPSPADPVQDCPESAAASPGSRLAVETRRNADNQISAFDRLPKEGRKAPSPAPHVSGPHFTGAVIRLIHSCKPPLRASIAARPCSSKPCPSASLRTPNVGRENRLRSRRRLHMLAARVFRNNGARTARWPPSCRSCSSRTES